MRGDFGLTFKAHVCPAIRVCRSRPKQTWAESLTNLGFRSVYHIHVPPEPLLKRNNVHLVIKWRLPSAKFSHAFTIYAAAAFCRPTSSLFRGSRGDISA